MSSPFPPETVDHIIDFLRDDLKTLKRCSLVSASWVPRSRKLLFANVKFYNPDDIKRWKRNFPIPSNSPACYTDNLSIYCPEAVTVDDTVDGGWMPAFSNITHLRLGDNDESIDGDPVIRLTPFYVFSSTLKSLHISSFVLSSSQTFDFIHSIPLLEDLSLNADTVIDDDGSSGAREVVAPSTSPPLDGTLELVLSQGIASITRRLLGQPNGLRISKLVLIWCEKGPRSIPDLVDACSNTLEYLDVTYELEDGTRRSTFAIDLSKATKLNGITFRCESLDSGWISQALLSIGNYDRSKHKDLEQISIRIPSKLGLVTAQNRAAIESRINQVDSEDKWHALDCHLNIFWSMGRTRTKIICPQSQTTKAARRMRDWAKFLLPGAMCMGGGVEVVLEPLVVITTVTTVIEDAA